ncbi:MAG: transcription antitermination factor NusB [Candidatus Saganbacteria bacterium]|nr:transcription antitermination factor NusB [Candidatus Saganbacteria bacterium]
MGKRSTSRRLAMQALYQSELAGSDIETSLKNITESEQFISETIEFASKLARAAWGEKDDLDQKISSLAIDWPLDRIGKVDRSILRLALKELDLKETPQSVVINEAVELAKKYSGEESAKFINGILGAYVRKTK